MTVEILPIIGRNPIGGGIFDRYDQFTGGSGYFFWGRGVADPAPNQYLGSLRQWTDHRRPAGRGDVDPESIGPRRFDATDTTPYWGDQHADGSGH